MKIDLSKIGRLYPFQGKFLKLPNSGFKYHYLDEGPKDAPCVVMVHGNPTWSFYYRNLILALKSKYRVIVPDHIGHGLSDRPKDYPYRLINHIENLETLLDHLKISSYNLVVHDWGGAIGMGVATRDPNRVNKIVIMNTAAFVSNRIPKRIQVCRLPKLGEFIIRKWNGFALPAVYMAVTKPLAKDVKQGYLLPYQNWKSRIGQARFVQDIPMSPQHPSRQVLETIETKLENLKGDKLLLWGGKDFCFNKEFFDRWRSIYPTAKYCYYNDAGHYVLEDRKDEIIQQVRMFFARNDY